MFNRKAVMDNPTGIWLLLLLFFSITLVTCFGIKEANAAAQPELVKTTPVDGATDVPVNMVMNLTFSAPVTLVDSSKITVTAINGAETVPETVYVDPHVDSYVLWIDLGDQSNNESQGYYGYEQPPVLSSSSTVTVKVDAGAVALASDSAAVLKDSLSFSFTTGDSLTPYMEYAVNNYVTAVKNNTPPAANPDSYTTKQEKVLTVAAPGVLSNDTDADGDSLTAVLVSDPGHGTVSQNVDGSLTYTPNTGYSGKDTYTYKANDGKADSNTTTVTITINPASGGGGSTPENTPPVANPDSYTTQYNTALTVAVPGVLNNDTDADGDSLTAVLVSDPGYGTVSQNADGSLTYTPNTGYSGKDTYTYKANDGKADSNVTTVTIEVKLKSGGGGNSTPVNHPPVANDDNYSTTEGKTLTVDQPGVLDNDTDQDNDKLTATEVTEPVHGMLEQNSDGSLTYTPEAGFTGEDTYTYKDYDGKVYGNTATVTINVTNNSKGGNSKSGNNPEKPGQPPFMQGDQPNLPGAVPQGGNGGEVTPTKLTPSSPGSGTIPSDLPGSGAETGNLPKTGGNKLPVIFAGLALMVTGLILEIKRPGKNYR